MVVRCSKTKSKSLTLNYLASLRARSSYSSTFRATSSGICMVHFSNWRAMMATSRQKPPSRGVYPTCRANRKLEGGRDAKACRSGSVRWSL
eukprot:3396402-Rhodomonas_salina.3